MTGGPTASAAAVSPARVRNALVANEYLDLRHAQVSSVAASASELYARLADATDAWIRKHS